MSTSRRSFLRGLASVIAGGAVSDMLSGARALAAAPQTQPAAEAARKPNIIFILADDLGYGDLGCYGQKLIRTPNLDKMAAEGMRFTQHYAGSTVCAPSRCCLLTGLHSGHGWMRGNAQGVKLRPDPQDLTVATLLRRAGYQTAMIGKSGCSANIDDGDHPNTKGFDYFFGFVSHAAAHDYFPPYLYRNGKKIEYPYNQRHEGDSYSGDLFYRDVMNYLDAHKDGPFFLHYSMQMPHASLYAPPESMAEYQGQFDEQPVTGQRHYRNEPQPKTTYAAMVSRLDWEVGQLLQKLHNLGIAENTLVLFASDNGAMNEGGYDRTWFNSSGQLTGGKRDLTEGGIRVPLIAWWPGKIAAGRTSDHVSAFWDFLPTACELAQTSAPDQTDGISYVPTLLGRAGQNEHAYLYWEFHEQGGKRAVRMGKWKAIQLDVDNNPDGPVAVYDLDADSAEKTDLSAEQGEIVQRARRIFREAHSPSPLFEWGQAR